MTESDIRKTVKALKKFYSDLVWFILGTALFSLIWLTFDREVSFWPKYIILVWGVSLLVSAYRRGILDHFLSRLFVLTQEWEEEKVSEIIGHQRDQRRIPLHRYLKK